MNAYDIITNAKTIVKRTDFDRTLALFFLNTVIKDFIRDNRLYPFYSLVTVTPDVYGEFTFPDYNLKSITNIEYIGVDGTTQFLYRIKDYEAAKKNFDFTSVGSPTNYVVYGDTVKLLPVPDEGTVKVYGEVYTADLTDELSSTNKMTNDVGNALVYLVAAEYFDMLQEEDRGKYWKQKGATLLSKYISYIKQRELDGVNIMYRNPWGNLPNLGEEPYIADGEDYDMGTF